MRGSKGFGVHGLGLVITLLLAAPAYAVDGVIEINQARAKAGGVTASDTPGFPVTIDKAGSYRLTSNLDVRNEPTPENVTAILIQANNVTLDLNGFAILGPVTCSPPLLGTVTACSPTGGGHGINGGGDQNVVMNGSVQGMGNRGLVFGGQGPRVEGVQVKENAGMGIHATGGAIIVNNISMRNGQTGISASFGSFVSGNTAFWNAGDGIETVSGASTVVGNTSTLNGGVGLALDSDTGYVNNVVKGNLGGTVSGGVQMGTNVCNGNTTCP